MSAQPAFIHACSNDAIAAPNTPRRGLPAAADADAIFTPVLASFTVLLRLAGSPITIPLSTLPAFPKNAPPDDRRIGLKVPSPRRPIPVDGVSGARSPRQRAWRAHRLTHLDHSPEATSLAGEGV
jgi:hypothetical protein